MGYPRHFDRRSRSSALTTPTGLIRTRYLGSYDIYPKRASVPQTGVHLLNRAMVDRRLVGGGTLFATMSEVAIAGRR